MKSAIIRQRYTPFGGPERIREQAPATLRIDDFEIAHAFIIYPGTEAYPMEKRVAAWPSRRIADLSAVLAGERAA